MTFTLSMLIQQLRKPNLRLCRLALLNILIASGLQPLSGATPPRRFGSGPLTRSVQNEADAAIARAQSWLVEQQAPDGSWGPTNLYLTAICALAVSGDGQQTPAAQEAAISASCRWLYQSPPLTNASLSSAEHQAQAWRHLALYYLSQEHYEPSSALASLSSVTTSNLLVELVVNETRTLSGKQLPAPEFAADAHPAESFLETAHAALSDQQLRPYLAKLAAAWSSQKMRLWLESEAQPAWWLARTLNRRAGGILAAASGAPLHWRRNLAGYWVNQQRITARGSGYWNSDDHSSIEETAFAILLLREL